ncbi:MAG: mechanosensitive ion channel family protein [Chloroflexi bacterium]|nr:mechanosensitive ion channel family protein [Chloroflexota bacterium]
MIEDLPDITIGSVTLGTEFWEVIFGIGTFLLFMIFAWIAHFMLNRVARNLTRKWKNQLGERLVQATFRPVVLLILMQGVFVGTAYVSALDRWREVITTAWTVLLIALVAVASTQVISAFLIWYARYRAPKGRAAMGRKLVSPLRRFSVLGIYLLAVLLVMDQLDISISPLIAGLGIGGIAVALALQPTLANFFAGTYLVGDTVIMPGDFIELESGLRGYVVEIGWRSTRLRTPFNNLVVIPNSRLADSILTNYYGPTMEIGVMVEAGVSYSSDLAHVERVALEVAQEVIDTIPEADKEFAPWFGFEKFGDSNIDFWIWVQATDRLSSFRMKTELMKLLHSRFKQEGIEINYPVRHLIFPDGQAPVPAPPTAVEAREVDGGSGP